MFNLYAVPCSHIPKHVMRIGQISLVEDSLNPCGNRLYFKELILDIRGLLFMLHIMGIADIIEFNNNSEYRVNKLLNIANLYLILQVPKKDKAGGNKAELTMFNSRLPVPVPTCTLKYGSIYVYNSFIYFNDFSIYRDTGTVIETVYGGSCNAH